MCRLLACSEWKMGKCNVVIYSHSHQAIPMLFSIPMELQQYSHSHGIPMGPTVPTGIPDIDSSLLCRHSCIHAAVMPSVVSVRWAPLLVLWWTKPGAMLWSRRSSSAVDSSFAGRRPKSCSFSTFSATRSTSRTGTTTSPWCWCWPTAASTLSSTPPSTASSSRASDVWNAMQNLRRMGENTRPIWSRLWTKVHVVLGRCRRPVAGRQTSDTETVSTAASSCRHRLMCDCCRTANFQSVKQDNHPQ